MSAAKASSNTTSPTLDPASGAKLFQGAAGLAVVGLILAAAAGFTDKARFPFSYLVGFTWLATIGLGALFFVLIQHLTRAGWSVGPRRQMEWLSGVLPACAVLFLPMFVFAHDVWHHWMGEHAAHDEMLHKKAAYLNPNFFYVRAVIFLVIWAVLAIWFARTSRAQDESGDPKLSQKMEGVSAPGVILFALSLTFAAFDWIMSLDPHWYSTIFGVYIFAGSAVSSLATLALMTIALQKTGKLGAVSTIEHRHDIGKLLFGFIVFWAYIGFSQFMLIWYANIPEETIFYRHRWEGDWKVISLALLIGHFVVPFIVLLSRHAKRSIPVLAGASVLMLVMHWVDIYWLVMPNFEGAHHHAMPTWVDLAGLLGPLGVGAVVVALRARTSPVYPLKDPRLVEATHVENL